MNKKRFMPYEDNYNELSSEQKQKVLKNVAPLGTKFKTDDNEMINHIQARERELLGIYAVRIKFSTVKKLTSVNLKKAEDIISYKQKKNSNYESIYKFHRLKEDITKWMKFIENDEVYSIENLKKYSLSRIFFDKEELRIKNGKVFNITASKQNIYRFILMLNEELKRNIEKYNESRELTDMLFNKK